MSTEDTTRDSHDELLAIRCQLGERPAFDALIARWHDPLWRYLRTLCDSNDVAADLAQDTWLRVLRGIVALREPRNLRPWLFGIARRVAMDRLRKKYAEPVDSDPVRLDELPSDEPDSGLELELSALESSIDALPLVEREVLVLFYLRELKLEHIATLTSVPIGTVKSRLFRARRLLRLRIRSQENLHDAQR